ncbi:hypothetical protein CQ009_22015 [Pseudomonas sp. MYb2]|nr:hypothetical protein CQ025_22790 [Pseudomonas sp. MYb3]PRC31514.1 hypothetical protein CQ009_22015 [Pseudomonas sp. MYb2]
MGTAAVHQGAFEGPTEGHYADARRPDRTGSDQNERRRKRGLNAKPVPWIKFRGLWLRRAGFEVSENVKVRVMKGGAVITAE